MTTTQLLLVVFGTLAFFAIGSFTCVIIDRLPLRLDEPNEYDELWETNTWSMVLGGNSRCSSCGEPVRAYDNIPVVSWIVLRGRCRGCGERIPSFHPLVELAAPVLFLVSVWALGADWKLLLVLWFIPVALAITVIDFRTFMVPTRIVWPALGVSVVLAVIATVLTGEWERLLGAAIGVAVMAGPLWFIWYVTSKKMGFGDVRLATFVGFNVGFFAYTGSGGALEPMSAVFLSIIAVALAALLGLVIGLPAGLVGGLKAKVPFGPSMLAAGLICMLAAAPILEPFTV